MRTVALNHCPIPSDKTRAKLLRHLLGRMLELVEDGLSVDVPADPFDFHAPLVSVSFSGRGVMLMPQLPATAVVMPWASSTSPK